MSALKRPTVLRSSPLTDTQAELYVVSWENTPDPFVKIGWTGNQRWKAFLRRGGQPEVVLRIAADEVRPLELLCHAMMAFEANPRFAVPAQAVPYLGAGGAGHTECYRTTGDHARSVVDALARRYVGDAVEVAL